MGGGGRGPGSPTNPRSSPSGTPHGWTSVGIGPNLLGQITEKEVYRSKDLSLVKHDSLPTSAAEFRSWRNSMLTRIASIAQSGSDIVLAWLMESFAEGKNLEDFSQSGLLPRLDTHLGALTMDPKHLKGELGIRFQTYAETCQNAGRAPRGRAFLFMLGQHFRLDLNRGSNLTQQALLDLPLEGYSIKDLEKFVERIEYVSNGVPQSHQPTEIAKFTWLYSRLKKRKILQRHIDRIRDSKETSHVRSWDWLMGKLKTALIESREDANEESIRTALYPKTKGPPPKAALPVNANPKGDNEKGSKDKDKDKDEGTKGLPNTSVKPKPKAQAKPSPGGGQSRTFRKG